MRKHTVFFTALTCVSALDAARAQAAVQPSRVSLAPRVDSLVRRLLAEEDGPSAVSIAVMRGRDTLVMGGWGTADREAGRPGAAETVYRIGSVTKQFTAALVLRLVERHRLTLGDSVAKYLPQLPDAWQAVTVRQLLDHTSGIPDYVDNRDWRNMWKDSVAPEALMALAARLPATSTPGTRWRYSNTNYVLLGRIVEALYGKPYASVIDEELARPLGLVHTRYCENMAGANGQAKGYDRREGRFSTAVVRHTSHPYAAGALCSTVGDLARWNAALHGGRVLGAETYALMTTPNGAARPAHYGLGLIAEPWLAGRSAFTHTGGVSGFQAANAWLPDDSISVTVLVNTTGVTSLDLLQRDLVALALGQRVPLASPTLDKKMLERYAGQYTVQIPGKPLGMRVWAEDGFLGAQPDGQRPMPLRPVGEHLFDTPVNATIRIAFVMENGVVTKGVLEQRGMRFDIVRMR